MPWCPKCKSEYREDYIVCADCGSKLVDDEQFRQMEAHALSGALLQDVGIDHSERETSDTGDTMRKSLDTGNIGKPESNDDEIGQQGNSTDNSRQMTIQIASGQGASDQIYQDSSERASENRSSAWVLLLVGGVGIVFLILGLTGIIPLHFGNSYLFYGVMAAVFILFLVAGVVSMKNALVFERKAESENSVRDTMLKWCRDHLNAEKIDGQIEHDNEETEEILYFRRFEYIKARLNYQFVNLDQGFLDNFIDDCVYDMIFGKNEEEEA